MSPRGTRALVLATLGLAAGAAWLGWRLATTEPASALAGATTPDDAGPSSRPAYGVEVAATDAALESARSDVLRADVDTDTAPTENFDLAGAHWIDVEVLLPFDTPVDEELAIVAACTKRGDASGADDPTFGSYVRVYWKSAIAKEEDWVRWARRAVGADGHARVPVPDGTRDAVLLLEGHYLYLVDWIVWHGEERVVLEPRLGARVSGRCLLPAGAAERGIELATLSGAAQAHDADAGLQGLFVPSSTAEVEGGAFELAALPVEPRYSVSVEVAGLVGYRSGLFALRPGEHRRLEVTPSLGARVRGHVLGDDRELVAGATVSLENRSWRAGLPRRSTETDAQGTFTLDGVPPGGAALTANATGWVSATTGLASVEDGALLEGVEIVLEPGVRIAGSVVWPDGRPAPGAEVLALHREASGEWPRAYRMAEATTDPDGSFVLRGFEADEPALVLATLALASQPDAPPWSTTAEDVALGTGDLHLVLARPIGLPGRVLDDRGAPLSAFEVVAEPADAGAEGTVRQPFEADDGAFRLGGLRPGRWRVSAEAEGFARCEPREVEVRATADGDPLELRLERLARVRGRVVGPDGAPVAGATVGPLAKPRAGRHRAGRLTETCTSDARGAFDLEGVPAPSATLVARHASWCESAPLAVELEPGAERDGVLLTLRLGGRITGEVRDASGRPAVSRLVSANESAFAFGRLGGPSTRTDAAGGFALEHVAPGTWTVVAAPAGEVLLDQLATEGEGVFISLLGETLSQRVELDDGEEVHVVLGTEPPDPVLVHGRVTRAGEPAGPFHVWIVREGGSLMQGFENTNTDDSGRFEVELDRPGDYVFAVQGTGRQVGFPVDVPDAETFDVELEMPGGRIAGTVVGPEGKPAPDVWLRLVPGRGAALPTDLVDGGFARTDEQGRYAFENLEPGAWVVLVRGMAEVAAAARSVDVEPGADVVGIDFVVTAPGVVQGTVRRPDGAPAAEATVFVRDVEGRLLTPGSSATTDADGHFSQNGLPQGPVTVSARAEGLATAEIPSLATAEDAKDIDLTLAPATVLRVALLDEDDTPLRLALSCRDEQDREFAGLMSSAQQREIVESGFTSREQTVGPLPPGTYRVRATADDGRSVETAMALTGEPEKRLELRLDG